VTDLWNIDSTGWPASDWGGSTIRERYIGRGMHLEFGHPDFWRVTTSRIFDVQEKN